MDWQAMTTSAMQVFFIAQPFLLGILLMSGLVVIGDKGTQKSLQRNSLSLAALCIFTFAIGAGLTMWYLLLNPFLTLVGLNFAISYPLIVMYWAFWMLAGVSMATKKLMYDYYKQRRHGE